MKTTKCPAQIWHGPGHQSRTNCQRTGGHVVHEARYGNADQLSRWKGDKAFSGPFDEPPWIEELDPSDAHGCAKEVRRLADRLDAYASVLWASGVADAAAKAAERDAETARALLVSLGLKP